MKNRVIALCVISISIVGFAFFAVTVLKQDAQGQKTEPERVTKLPSIVSKIGSLELVNAGLRDEGTPNAVAVLEIKNNSDKSIIAVAIESGDGKERSGTNMNGFNDGDDPPTIIVRPYDNFEALMSLANLRPGFPIRISGVMYADGSEEGEKAALETMHRQKEHYKAIRKGEPKQ